MKMPRKILAFAIVATIVLNAAPIALACGPGYIEPVFAFEGSPDIPFEQFTGGNIGIVRPTFGPKALVIAYRYLNGGGFNAVEQKQLVHALRATEPDETSEEDAVKGWLEARKDVLPDEKLPSIYTDRPAYGGYNFFPNCTANAFEVAAKTLKDRAGTYGSDNRFVREWLDGQDRVFDICSSGSKPPDEINAEMPDWLKKDRAYQIAAAHFYMMKYGEARRRFAEIAADGDSPWRQTADYLVGRTLVREASLTKAETRQLELYEQAEQQLQSVLYRGGNYADAAEKLLNLVKYRIRPKERIAELSRTLAFANGNQNLRQDLIDHSWLLDKFEAEVASSIEQQKRKEREAEEARTLSEEERQRRAANGNKAAENKSQWELERDAIENGEIIRIGYSYAVPGQEYAAYASIQVPFDASDEQILTAFARHLGRELKPGEAEKILEQKVGALEQRKYYLGANFRFGQARRERYEGGYRTDTELPTDAIPEFLRGEDLTDWIVTFQLGDDPAYKRSVARYGETKSNPWLISALAKAKKDSPEVEKLIADGLKMSRTAPAYLTAVYHVARLKIEQGRDAEASKLLDELIASGVNDYPVSARNMFLELRLRVAKTLDEFLRFAGRRPVAFSNSGYEYGFFRDFYENEKGYWNKENYKETKEEYLNKLAREYAEMLPWDDRTIFDERTVDVMNRHFPIDLLAEAALSKELPEHLRPRMVTTVWTRAVLLGRGDLAAKFAGEAVKSVPDMAETFTRYLSIKTLAARRNEELWILIKNPKLSAFVAGGLPERGENEISSWEDGWWFPPSDTYYERGEELPKPVPKPSFVTARQAADARVERQRIADIGDAEKYLTQRVFAWATASPRDPRAPEALYIVAVINLETKYGGGNQENREDAIKMLASRYPNSPWVAKAKSEEY